MPFRDYLSKLAPTSLQRTRFSQFIGELGGAMDTLTSTTKSAVKARFPGVGATDSVDAVAGDRQLEKNQAASAYNPDTLVPSNFAARVKDAWARWSFGGTAYGLLRELWVLGYHNVHVVIVNGKSYTLVSDTGVPATDLVVGSLGPQSWWPSGVNVGGGQPVSSARGWWTRFTVIFDATLPTPAGSGAPSDWTVALPSATSNEVNAIRRVIARWKPASAVCDRIVVLPSGTVYGWPTSTTWGQASLNWGTNPATYWSP